MSFSVWLSESSDGWVATFFLWSPLELEHHVIMSNKSMDGTVEVERAPQQQTVLSPQLRNHDRHQSVGERLKTHDTAVDQV